MLLEKSENFTCPQMPLADPIRPAPLVATQQGFET